MDFDTTGAMLHVARERLEQRKDAGHAESAVETMAAAITKAVADYITSHRDAEFTLTEITDFVDTRMRMASVLEPNASAAQIASVHDATEAATRLAVERMSA